MTAAVFVLLFLFRAHAQLFVPDRPLSVVRTEHFDIIYPEESAYSALRLSEYAEIMYADITGRFGTDIDMRLPVVITPDTDVLNGYYTPFPRNRIVLYDTLPSEGELACFDDTLAGVFYHELTHAVTANIRSPFWKGVSAVIGDAVSPPMMFNMTPVFTEGSAVAFESFGGVGRMNDPAALQMLIQAKIDGSFFSWKQAAGSRDIYPSGSVPYIYGGAFAFWLIHTYGDELYASLWRQAGTVHFFKLAPGIFKKVYGVTLAEAWENFRSSVPVPGSLEYNGDFADASPGRIVSVAAYEGGLAWIDSAASSVFFVDTAAERQKPRKLFSCGPLDSRISFSRDGRYVLLTSARAKGSGYERELRIYDRTEERFTDFSARGLRDASFVMLKDGREAVAAVRTVSQKAFLCVLSVPPDGGQYDVLFSREMESGVVPFSPCGTDSGYVACIEARGTERDIALYDPLSGERAVILFPGKKPGFIRYLSSSEGKLVFGWAEKDSLYRLGFADTGGNTAVLQKNDISGGVSWPVVADGVCYYAASFSGSMRVMKKTLASFDTEKTAAEVQHTGSGTEYGNGAVFSADVSAPPVSAGNRSASPAKYSPASYMFRGFFLPWVNLSFFAEKPRFQADPGFFFVTGDPAEKWTFSGSVLLNTAFLFPDVALALDNASFPVKWGVSAENAAVPYDDAGRLFFRRTSASVYAKSDVFLSGLSSVWTFSGRLMFAADSALFRRADISCTPDIYRLPTDTVFAGFLPELSYAFAASTGLGAFDRTGFEAGLSGEIRVPLYQRGGEAFTDALFAGKAQFRVYSGKLIPVRNTERFTFSLPFSVSVSAEAANRPVYFPAGSSSVRKPLKAGFSAEIVLFSTEIQNGLPLVPLYVNRFFVSCGYSGSYAAQYDFSDGTYGDEISAACTFVLSPLVGTAASVHFSLETRFRYFLRTGQYRLSIGSLYIF